MIKQISKKEIVEMLKTKYNAKSVKIVTVNIGDEYNTLIDDSGRPLDLNIEVN